MKSEKVKEIMTLTPISCNPETTMAEAISQLSLAEVNALVVVASGSGELRGVISQFDILKHFGDDPHTTNAGQIMSDKLQRISGDASIEDAARKMIEKGVHRLIVAEEGAKRAEGVISASDIIQAMAAG